VPVAVAMAMAMESAPPRLAGCLGLSFPREVWPRGLAEALALGRLEGRQGSCLGLENL
jgi:hypothetical protein